MAAVTGKPRADGLGGPVRAGALHEDLALVDPLEEDSARLVDPRQKAVAMVDLQDKAVGPPTRPPARPQGEMASFGGAERAFGKPLGDVRRRRWQRLRDLVGANVDGVTSGHCRAAAAALRGHRVKEVSAPRDSCHDGRTGTFRTRSECAASFTSAS